MAIRWAARRIFGQYTVSALTLQARGVHSTVETDQYVLKSPRASINIPQMPLHEFVWLDMDRWSDKIALECGVTGRKYTYVEARKMSRCLASALQHELRLQQGESFAILSPNLPEYPLLLLGAAEAGLVASTVNPLYTPDEIAKQVKDCNARLIITIPVFFANAQTAISKLKLDIPILVIRDSANAVLPPGGVWLDDVLSQSSGEVRPVSSQADDNVVLPYSSGTTGLPKGVQLTHGNIVANLAQMDTPEVRLLLQTSPNVQDTVLGLLPFFHIYGMVVVALSTLQGGGRVVTVPRFEPELFLKTIVEQHVGILYLVPPLVLFLGGNPNVKPEHLKYVRMTNSGAAPVGLSDVVRFREKAKHICTLQGYGMTETSPVTLMSDRTRMTKYACTGVGVPNALHKVVDVETGLSLPAHKHGEIYVKGPHVMKGYLNREDANDEIFRDGWLRTGDIGYYDDEGDFFIVDRIKELIKVKGFQVAPAELEEILRTHPKLSDAAVIGVQDARLGEAPRAFVVAKEGASVEGDEVAAYVAARVAEYKQLSGGVVLLPAIPKSAAGKILRKELRAKYSS